MAARPLWTWRCDGWCSTNEEYLQVASRVVCNLLLAFSPSREVKHWCSILGLKLSAFVSFKQKFCQGCHQSNCVSWYTIFFLLQSRSSNGSVGMSIWPSLVYYKAPPSFPMFAVCTHAPTHAHTHTVDQGWLLAGVAVILTAWTAFCANWVLVLDLGSSFPTKICFM